MVQHKNSDESGVSLDGFVRLTGNLLNKVGIIGFIVIFGSFFIYKFTDVGQKKEIIDTWFLFKNPMSINILIGFNFLFFITLIFHNFHYKSKITVLNQRIDELADEKKTLQQLLLNKKLNSTK